VHPAPRLNLPPDWCPEEAFPAPMAPSAGPVPAILPPSPIILLKLRQRENLLLEEGPAFAQ